MSGNEVSKICIVGNSPNVFDREAGEFIDSCDHVVRINDFKVEGYEKHVGSKIDIVTCALSAPFDGHMAKQAKEVWSSRPIDGRRASVARRSLGGIPLVQPSQKLWGELVGLLKGFWRPQPSSGLATIGMVMERFPDAEIYIIGFDNEKFKKHYFDPSFLDDDSVGPVGHDWATEYEYIQSLLDEGRLKEVP